MAKYSDFNILELSNFSWLKFEKIKIQSYQMGFLGKWISSNFSCDFTTGLISSKTIFNVYHLCQNIKGTYIPLMTWTHQHLNGLLVLRWNHIGSSIWIQEFSSYNQITIYTCALCNVRSAHSLVGILQVFQPQLSLTKAFQWGCIHGLLDPWPFIFPINLCPHWAVIKNFIILSTA